MQLVLHADWVLSDLIDWATSLFIRCGNVGAFDHWWFTICSGWYRGTVHFHHERTREGRSPGISDRLFYRFSFTGMVKDSWYCCTTWEGRNALKLIHGEPSSFHLLQELAQRMFPLCENYILIDQFVEARSHFRNGLVNHAFAAALRALLLVGHFFMFVDECSTSIMTWHQMGLQ